MNDIEINLCDINKSLSFTYNVLELEVKNVTKIKGFEFLGEILQLKIPPGHDF